MEEVPAEMEFAIDGSFAVAAGDIVIKQEPQDEMMLVVQPEDEVMESSFIAEDACDDEHQVYPHPEEIDDVILQRAVSPPTYADHCDPEELMLLYKEKYQLKDLTVQLENCDKIWETLQLIKNIQGFSNDDDDEGNLTSNNFASTSPSPIPTVAYQPSIGNSNSALPDFRFSVKSKKILYHCVSCGKEFGDRAQLRQHALDNHGVFVSPKRIYKVRADAIAKNVRMSTAIKTEDCVSDLQNPDSMVQIPLSEASLQEKKMSRTTRSTDNCKDSSFSVKAIENPISTISNIENSTSVVNAIQTPALRGSGKEKIKCILCKRTTTDIVSHMKGYHKVGCLSSIITQCEKVVEDTTIADSVEPESSNPVVPDKKEPSQPVVTTSRKRKRNTPRWTVPKRKFKQNTQKSVRLSLDHMKVSFKKYKCDVCFGIYKTTKSFSYHKKLHRIRGETPENFDPSKCRFLNSPLRKIKHNPNRATLNNNVRSRRVPVKIESPITNNVTSPDESVEQSIKPEESIPLNASEPTVCECGRSFRTYHTLYMHKLKCQQADGKGSQANDSDSGVGISIKIKKNKNDSYEVVPKATSTEESFKESKSCKDSDASSNDSGVVSVSSNDQKNDCSQSAESQSHSVMRILVEDNDEEVDIEDENSNQSTFNGNGYPPLSGCAGDATDTTSTDSTENGSLHNGIGSTRSSSRRSSAVPSLKNLCRQEISKSEEKSEDLPVHRCHTCLSHFRTKTDLMEHVSNTKHDVKSFCSCGKEFKSLKYFNIHVRRFHPLMLNCSYCMTNFDRIEKYLGHKCDVVEGKLFIEPIIQTECMKCKELLDLGEQFDKHMKTHSTENANLYHCYKCELTFDNPYQRRNHFSKEHGFSPCRICGKVLHIDFLSKHEAYHDGLGHPCHLCKKTFSQKTLLKKHVQGTHDPLANKVVKCVVCLKNLKLRQLKKHMSFHLHTEICKKCNKCYRSDESNDIEEHVAADHPDDYPVLKCENCQMSFISEKKHEQHCQEGSCKNNANDVEMTVQNATT